MGFSLDGEQGHWFAAGSSSQWPLLLWSAGSRVCRLQELQRMGLVAPGLVGIFPEQGLNPCLLHWQAHS